MEDYRPLINDVLIRVRTELCVLESFTRETAVPSLSSLKNRGFELFLRAVQVARTVLKVIWGGGYAGCGLVMSELFRECFKEEHLSSKSRTFLNCS